MTFQDLMKYACEDWQKRLKGMTGRQAWAYLQSMWNPSDLYDLESYEVREALSWLIHDAFDLGIHECPCRFGLGYIIFMPYEMICEALGVEP